MKIAYTIKLMAIVISLLMIQGCSEDSKEVAYCDTSLGDNGWEKATLVEPGAEVSPQSSDTQIRVWHFQNSQEYVCVLQGEAVFRKHSIFSVFLLFF